MIEKFLCCCMSLSTGCQLIGCITAAANFVYFLLLLDVLIESHDTLPFDDEYSSSILGEMELQVVDLIDDFNLIL
jgi:hypothetical protein